VSANAGPDIVEDGLVCCLDANDPKSYNGNGSIWYDRSNESLEGSLDNSPLFTGKSFNFNGINQKVQVTGLPDLSANNAFTVEVWAKSDNSTWNDFGYLASRRNQFVIHPQQSSREVRMYFHTGGWGFLTVTPNDIEVWHQYVLVFNAGYREIYLDGESISSASSALTLTSTTSVMNIGLDSGSRWLDGDVGCVRIYDRLITTKEVQQNYNATKSRFSL